MEKFKARCWVGNTYTERIIECREMTIKDGSYLFWTGEYGATNRLLWAFPIMHTIVEGIYENETK